MSGIFPFDLSDMDGPDAVVVMSRSWISKTGPLVLPETRTDEEIRLLANCLSVDEAERVLRERKRMAASLAREVKRSPRMQELLRSRGFKTGPPLGRRKKRGDPAIRLIKQLKSIGGPGLETLATALRGGRKSYLDEVAAVFARMATECGLKPSKKKILGVLLAKLPQKQTTIASLAVAIVKTMDKRDVNTLRKAS